ncbi:MAG: Sfum_1244 family protein [Gammaproteobacteria bacterium]
MSAISSSTAPVTPVAINTLVPTLSAVRTNCHISDARHAADYTLCVYLLKMREYFRWENNIPFNSALQQEAVSDWLTKREQHWDTLDQEVFKQVPVAGGSYDPFDATTINANLNDLGYVYSSGYGRNMKPLFFLGELEKHQQYDGYTLLVSGREYARDLTAPPAMSQGNTIYVRRESLRRMLWEKIEEWRWNKPVNAMQNALACYDFDNDHEAALEAMTENELDAVILHEIGEVMAGAQLGEEWEALLVSLPQSKAELMVRSVRDHLADALSTLPGLLQSANTASLHFYIANLANMRKALFPKLLSAYATWTATGSTRDLENTVQEARNHWQSVAAGVLELFREQGPDCQHAVVALIEDNAL